MTTPEGVLSCDPIKLVEAERDKFKDLWEAEESPEGQRRCRPDAFRTDSQEMKRHSASNLRQAAKTFSCTTASTYDGFHPRHFHGLSDEALTALGVLLDTCEDIGNWPDVINAVVTALIPKATGACAPSGHSAAYTHFGPEHAGLKRLSGSALTTALTSQPGKATALWIQFGTNPLEPSATLLTVQQRRPFWSTRRAFMSTSITSCSKKKRRAQGLLENSLPSPSLGTEPRGT